MVAHPQLSRADPCHPFRLPLLHEESRDGAGGPRASSPTIPLPVPARWEQQLLSMSLGRAVSLLFFTPVGMKLSWELGQAVPCTRWCHQQQWLQRALVLPQTGEEAGRIWCLVVPGWHRGL